MIRSAFFPGRRVPARPGHPFRRTLPERALRPVPVIVPVHEPEVRAAMARALTARTLPTSTMTRTMAQGAALRSPPVNPARITARDVRDFLLAYCACFVALMAFLS
ncbi:MAG: hypothetical protein OC190_01835 [Novosphingobium aromaticivorans]|nr:hypothetical protein [Novosphingobium aromaticivorans]